MTRFLSDVWVFSVDITVRIDIETDQNNMFGKFNLHENEKLTITTWKFNCITVIGPSLVIITLFSVFSATRTQAFHFFEIHYLKNPIKIARKINMEPYEFQL